MISLRLQVAVGIVYNENGQILVSKRLSHQTQGGFWEFPGGKLEKGETVAHALSRELFEEVGIQVLEQAHWFVVDYDYQDKSVSLHVQKVLQFQGAPWGKEGQEIQWRTPAEILQLDWLPANQAIVKALQNS